LRFESRELKPYAQPITKTDLRIGSTYFFLNFDDPEMLYPNLQAVVFLGRDLEEGDQGPVYFQDLSSYSAGVRYPDAAEVGSAAVFSGSENELGHVFEFEHALDQLLACSLRRRTARV